MKKCSNCLYWSGSPHPPPILCAVVASAPKPISLAALEAKDGNIAHVENLCQEWKENLNPHSPILNP